MRRHYIPHVMARYDIATFPGGWQSAAYRVAAIGALVCLHAGYDARDRATWPTLARLKEAMAGFRLSSPRQIDDLVARLAATGHVALEQVEADGRVRLLRPTERLLAWDREVLGAYYDSLQMLYPEPGYGPAVARDPGFALLVRRAAPRYFAVIARFLQENADLLPFHGMYQGTHILMAAAELGAGGAPLRERDLAGLQPRLGVSRSHIRNTLLAAEQAGLLAQSGLARKSIALTPRGLAAIDRFVADTLSSHDLGYRLALADRT